MKNDACNAKGKSGNLQSWKLVEFDEATEFCNIFRNVSKFLGNVEDSSEFFGVVYYLSIVFNCFFSF